MSLCRIQTVFLVQIVKWNHFDPNDVASLQRAVNDAAMLRGSPHTQLQKSDWECYMNVFHINSTRLYLTKMNLYEQRLLSISTLCH